MSVVLFGASDDLIELDGDIVEEFSARDGSNLVAFSEGTVLRIEYARSGVWRISPVKEGLAFLTITQAPEGDDDNYSDRAELSGPIAWAMHGVQYAAAKS